MQIRRLIAVTLACSALVFITTVVVASGRAQAGGSPEHTCSAADKQYLDTVSTNMLQLWYWSDALVHNDVKPAVVVKQAVSEAAQIDATRPTDPTFAKSRGLLRAMFIEYGRAVYAKSHGGNAGLPMGSAYRLANDVHDLLAGAQPALAARGCDPAPLLK